MDPRVLRDQVLTGKAHALVPLAAGGIAGYRLLDEPDSGDVSE